MSKLNHILQLKIPKKTAQMLGTTHSLFTKSCFQHFAALSRQFCKLEREFDAYMHNGNHPCQKSQTAHSICFRGMSFLMHTDCWLLAY